MGTPATQKTPEIINKALVEKIAFKVPALPERRKVKKSGQIVLPEEQYVAAMEKIIQRDFFPDLDKLRAQNEFLDASDDIAIRKETDAFLGYGNHVRAINASGKSPTTFETPTRNVTNKQAAFTPKDAASQISKAEDDINVDKYPNLDSFLSSCTSEDNDSFQNIIESAKAKLEQKLTELYKVKPSNMIESGESNNLPMLANGTMRNSIMFIPDGVDLTVAEKIEMRKLEREIAHVNTRLVHNPFNDNQNKQTITELARTQAKTLIGKVGVDGNILQNNANGRAPFDFVKTPSPAPGVASTPFMTWGEIDDTPFRLDGSDTPVRPMTGPCFRINETSRREVIALELAEKAGERMRAQKRKTLEAARKNTPLTYSGRASTDRLASLSPAAQRLAADRLGLRSSIITPRTLNRGSVTPGLSSKNPTPLVRRPTSQIRVKAAEQSEDINLTDNLLKIPAKRHKAADFF